MEGDGGDGWGGWMGNTVPIPPQKVLISYQRVLWTRGILQVGTGCWHMLWAAQRVTYNNM